MCYVCPKNVFIKFEQRDKRYYYVGGKLKVPGGGQLNLHRNSATNLNAYIVSIIAERVRLLRYRRINFTYRTTLVVLQRDIRINCLSYHQRKL